MANVVPMARARRGRRKNQISGQFAWRLIEMLESVSYRVLSLSARRILDRLEIELGHHGGQENGRLPVTFGQFQEFGIDRHAIAPAIRECIALGFIEITERGCAGNADFRRPNIFRLTYRHTDDHDPTDEWRKIRTLQAAETVARTARAAGAKMQNSSGGKRRPQWGKPTPSTAFSGGENPHYNQGGETPTTSISRGDSP
jgi:hypothetical protein